MRKLSLLKSIFGLLVVTLVVGGCGKESANQSTEGQTHRAPLNKDPKKKRSSRVYSFKYADKEKRCTTGVRVFYTVEAFCDALLNAEPKDCQRDLRVKNHELRCKDIKKGN